MKLFLRPLFLLFLVNSTVFAQVIQQQSTNNAAAPEMNRIQELEEVPAEQDYRSRESVDSRKKESKPVAIEATMKEEQLSISKEQMVRMSNQLQSVSTIARKHRTTRSPYPQEQTQIDQLVNQLEKTDNQSFEYNYFKYLSGNHNTKLFPYLKKASQLRPTNTDVNVQLVSYYWITDDQQKALTTTELLFASGRLDKAVLDYAADVLLSVPLNGLLLTYGMEDTYAVLYQQAKHNLRKDVQLISLDWLQSEAYRNSWSQKGLVIPKQSQIDVQFVSDFLQQNSAKNIALSFTLPAPFLQEVKSELYVNGLVALYSNQPFNKDINQENKQLFEVMNCKVINDPSSNRAAQLSINYVPMLIAVKSRCMQLNDAKAVERIAGLIQQITIQSKRKLD